MYDQDSFFDLSTWGQIGLACLCGVLFLLVFFGARSLLRKQTSLVRFIGAFVIFWLFVWMSPQVYYQYYRIIIEDLPQQWVIWPPRWPLEALQLLFFQGPQNLSAHSQGLLGWSLLAGQFLLRPKVSIST